ncbi:MAG: DUF456 domain-containing protein [Kiritimatiellae bacterium]|nr:DUF456 domain-containing protein [Kiritimatiellia bacterium]
MADVAYMSFGALLLLVGLAGCFVPVVPGPFVAYCSLFAALGVGSHVNPPVLAFAVAGAFIAAVTVFDYVVPALGARRFDCTRAGQVGCVVGTIAGLFFVLQGGILVGPFLGAFLGELLAGRSAGRAFKGAFGAFIGFLAGMTMKVLSCLMMALVFAAACYFNLRG